jgi:hypothetical protein
MVSVTLDGRAIDLVGPIEAVAAGGPGLSASMVLAPGPHRLAATVENDRGIARVQAVDLVVPGPPPPRRAKLYRLALAPTVDDPGFPPIPKAGDDVADLLPFLGRHLVSGEGGDRLEEALVLRLLGAEGSSDRFLSGLKQIDDDKPGDGDVLAVVIEANVLSYGREAMIVGSDARGRPPRPSIPALAVSEILGRAAKRGCKVVVLLDGSHGKPAEGFDPDATDWVRQLRRDCGVIVFLASDQGTSREARAHRAFAQAFLDSVGPGRRTRRKDGLMTLFDVRDGVSRGVQELTRRQQNAACYIPDSLDGRFPLLNPRPR